MDCLFLFLKKSTIDSHITASVILALSYGGFFFWFLMAALFKTVSEFIISDFSLRSLKFLIALLFLLFLYFSSMTFSSFLCSLRYFPFSRSRTRLSFGYSFNPSIFLFMFSIYWSFFFSLSSHSETYQNSR